MKLNSDANANSRSKDGVDFAIEDHPGIKMINQYASFESRFSLKEIRGPDIQKEISNLNSKSENFWKYSYEST